MVEDFERIEGDLVVVGLFVVEEVEGSERH